MQVIGPIALTGETLVSEPDPAKYTPPSNAVQVQNYSGFQLVGTIGGQPVAIPPFTSTTLHFLGQGLLQVTPTSSLSSSQGSMTLVWTLPGETSPVKDGPLTTLVSSTVSLTVTGTPPGPWTIEGVNPSYLSYTFVVDNTGVVPNTITIKGTQSGQVYATFTVAAVGFYAQTESFQTNPLDSTLTMTESAAGISGTPSAQATT